MVRLRSVACLFIAFLMAAPAFAREAGAPISPTPVSGALGDGTCAQGGCHTGTFPAPDIAWALLDQATGAPLTTYQPGTTSTITLAMSSTAATSTGRHLYGFQMTVRDSGGLQGWNPFPAAINSRYQVQNVTGRGRYTTHRQAGTIPAPVPPPLTGTGNAWDMAFTAPPPGTGDVTFYFCLNHANDNGSPTLDFIRCDAVDVTEAVVGPVDRDGDGIDDAEEGPLGTSPDDADSDDDGISDGQERTIGTNPIVSDTDADGLPDGLETSVTTPVPDPDGGGPLLGTDVAAGAFIADGDPATSTNPLSSNTDGDGDAANPCRDGDEDADADGAVDPPSETDPNADDCPPPVVTDRDGDGLLDVDESARGTSPTDVDSDDDGVSDGREVLIGTDPVVADTDGDGLTDGLETGVTTPLADPDGGGPLQGTNVAAGNFTADANPATVTNPRSNNTDGDGDLASPCLDGDEDANRDGAVDAAGETDPAVADCPTGAPTTVGLRQAAVTALSGGQPATCGPRTVPPEETLFDTPCGDSPTCTPGAWSITGGADAQLDVSLGEWIRPGEASPDFEPEVLVFYELESCSIVLTVEKRGSDLVLGRR